MIHVGRNYTNYIKKDRQSEVGKYSMTAWHIIFSGLTENHMQPAYSTNVQALKNLKFGSSAVKLKLLTSCD